MNEAAKAQYALGAQLMLSAMVKDEDLDTPLEKMTDELYSTYKSAEGDERERLRASLNQMKSSGLTEETWQELRDMLGPYAKVVEATYLALKRIESEGVL